MLKINIKQASGNWDNFKIEAFMDTTECDIKFKFSDKTNFIVAENIPNITKGLGMEDHDSIIKRVAQGLIIEGLINSSGLLNFIVKTLLSKERYEKLLLESTIKTLHIIADIYIYYPLMEGSISDNGSIAQVELNDHGKTYLHYDHDPCLPC